ncbi:MAG: xanthan lyase [Bacteroidales bacterium]
MRKYILLLALALASGLPAQKKTSEPWRGNLDSVLNDIMKQYPMSGKGKVESYRVSKNTKEITFTLSPSFSNTPIRKELIDTLQMKTRALLPGELKSFNLKFLCDGRDIGYYIPNALRKVRIKDKSRQAPEMPVLPALVRRASTPYKISEGLNGNHIALWQSHGLYFDKGQSRWGWQRAKLFQTVEDLFTQSFVLPYLVPMLENAGAVTLLPRERDWNRNEVIVDEDQSTNESFYNEQVGRFAWESGPGQGFAHKKATYTDGENPFEMGGYRVIPTVLKKEDASQAIWMPEIPEKGEYAVYISYQSLPKSATDAEYTVHHAGGETRFLVNQRMGGGTWIYLGTFVFEKGRTDHAWVKLTNRSKEKNTVITADAVKFGGGMGNIARSSQGGSTPNAKSSEKQTNNKSIALSFNQEPEISGKPRFTEGARYWMQWAGVPFEVYSPKLGTNDYIDDYSSRGGWVNYLAGGSALLPDSAGLNIPVDLAFAFHSDAGTLPSDSTVGTLGIYYSKFNNGKFSNGKSRMASRDLTDLIQSEVIEDIRMNFEPKFTRRAMWDKSYAEARIPEVPTMLLELLSHQNFADMRYGLDPRFRFVVSRAIYKGMLKFVANQHNRGYHVQPLPVHSFAAEFTSPQKVKLSWEPTTDISEPTAEPERYVVYKRKGNGAFDNGTIVEHNHVVLPVETGERYSFKVAAVNKGGVSFCSEILSIYQAPHSKGTVLIVNGFNRISAPGSFATPDSTMGGFSDLIDFGVPDKRSIDYIGKQYEYRRSKPWVDDDNPGFGGSYNDCAGKVIAGNTFDYPALHGRSFEKLGFSYVSMSDEAFQTRNISPKKYAILDFILGKERETILGRGAVMPEFIVFDTPIQKAITAYAKSGGKLLISGSFVGTDLWEGVTDDPERRKFAEDVLKFKWRSNHASSQGQARFVASPYKFGQNSFSFHNTPNEQSYAAEHPDGIEPSKDQSFTFMRYEDTNISAAVGYYGKDYRSVVLGFPIETVKTDAERDQLIRKLVEFLINKTIK